jgi:hypothetical protein
MRGLPVVIALGCLACACAAQRQWQVSPVNGHYYLLGPGGTWHDGESWAQRAGGHLATIRSETENDWVFSWVPPDTRAWIGMTDEAREGIWVWTSGELVTFTNWASGQPDNSQGVEHWCEFRADWSGEWNDLTETHRAGVIEVPARAGVARFGAPGTSCDGPILADVLRAPVSGDPWFGFSCAGAPPESGGFLFVATDSLASPWNVGGMQIWVDPWSAGFVAVPVRSTSTGWCYLSTPLPDDTQGMEVCVQFAWLNTPPCGPWATLSGSDGLRITVQ